MAKTLNKIIHANFTRFSRTVEFQFQFHSVLDWTGLIYHPNREMIRTRNKVPVFSKIPV
jgi:hypothetical protein